MKGLRQPKIPFGCKTVCWFCYISLYVGNYRLKILKAVSNKRRMISQDLKKKGRTSLLRYITHKVSTWPVDYSCFHNIKLLRVFLLQSSFQLRSKSNPGLYSVGFPLLRSVIGPENSRLSLSQSIIYKIKTNHVLVAPVFPRFRHSGWFYFEFSLVIKDIFLSSDWLLW